MFTTHFKLTRQPFLEHAPVTALWRDDRMAQGLARLEFLIQSATAALVTGQSGVGKSALIKRFLDRLPRPHCEAVYVHLTHLPSAGLLKLLVSKLGEVPRRGKDRLFEQILDRARRSEGTLLLVFDEAHLLGGESLTDLRLLVSSAIDEAPPLKMILAGQESLRATLRRSVHADFLDRITVRFHLSPLTKEQTATYIDFQMKEAGGSDKLFEESVKTLIHEYTGGIPRQINNLATACLLEAAAESSSRVSEASLQRTLNEFRLP